MSAAIFSGELLVAVLVASVMGSLHCVGMCGPFALMASGSTSVKAGSMRRMMLYHLGRLTTYLIAGGLAGFAGAALSTGGQWLGIQSAAARVAGAVMIVLGAMRLVSWLRSRRLASPGNSTNTVANSSIASSSVTTASGLGVRISGWIAKTRPTVNRLPPSGRAFAAGTLTTLLPCGWLYLFLLVAAGTGAVSSALLVMAAFWIGTVPALTALVLGALQMAPRFRSALPLMGALLLLVTGLYTATGRAAADMSALADSASRVRAQAGDQLVGDQANGDQLGRQTLEMLSDEPLPCCRIPASGD